MRPHWMLAVGLATALSGCVAGTPMDGPSDGSGGTDGGSDGSGGTPIDPCPTGDCDPTAACEASVSGSPLLRRLTARELETALSDVFPEVKDSWISSMSSDPVSHFGFDNEAARLVVSKQTARDIDATAAAVGAAVGGSALATILPCSASAADAACAAEFLAKYGRRLFRRPLTDAETTSFATFFADALAASSFPEAISWLTKALIHAPATLYRSEVGTLLDGSRQLSQYEVATALSFTYAGTTPSDELLAQAESGTLDSPDALIAAAEQLAASAGGHGEVQRFFESAMQYGRVATLTKNNVNGFDQLRGDMLAETRAFIAGVVLDGGGGLDELLTANVTYPSVALASHYGLPAPSADYAEVQRTNGVGLLAQGSVLSTEASSANSSPTQRGLLVLEKLLCRDLPQVPATVPELPTGSSEPTTTRQRYEELHITGGAHCATCHADFDPIGFGFEHFDEAGRYREKENGLDVDSVSFVPHTTPEIAFTGQEDLAAALAEMDEVQLCVSGQLKTFSFGTEEACLGEGQREAFMAGDIGFVDYWTSLAGDPHFVSRRQP
jgi:hypothetical protein